MDNLNATNFTGTFSGELGDMTLSVTGTDINKLFGGGDSIGTVYISNVHFDYSGAGFEFDLQAAGTGIEINFDEVHEDRVTLLDGRFESFSFTTNDLSVTAEGLIDFAYHYSVVDVPDGFGGSYSVEKASADIDGKLTDLTIEYLSAPENYTLSLGGDIHFSMDASGEVSIDGSSFTHFSISESGNYFTYAGDFTYHGDIDTGHVSGSVTEITAAVAGASFVLKGDIEVDDNDVSGYITDLTLHAEGDDLEGNPYDATYSFTGKHVDILDLFEEGDDKIKDINGDGESNEYDLVDFMLNHIDGATLTGVNLPPHAVDDKGTTDSKTTLSVDAAHGLLANDTDWEGDGLTVSEVRFDGKSYTVGEWHVTDDWDETPVSRFIINADGSYEFTPLDDYFSDFHHEDSESGSFDYRVTDTSGNSSLYAKLTITVTGANNAPEVGTTPLESDADEGDKSYELDMLEGAFDPDGDSLSVGSVTYTVDGGTASATVPDGLSLDGDTLTVDPSDPAFDSIAEGSSRTITVDYTISDGFGGSVAQTAEVTIDGVNDAPTVANTIADQNATEDSEFSFTLPSNTFADVDADDSLTYTATLSDDSALPAWLTFNAETGEFSGTPENSDVGEIEVNVTATDDSDASVSDTFTLTVENTNDAPTVANAITDQNATEDAAFSFTLPSNTFADVDADDSLTYTATLSDDSALPAWLTFNAETGEFSGTPENGDVGEIEVKVTATDDSDASVSDTFTLTVENTNDAPMSEDDHVTMTSEGTEKVLALTDFGTFSDPDTGDTLQTVKITSVVDGELRLYPDMVPLAAMVVGMPAPAYTLVGDDDEITWEQIENGQLRFAPGSGVNTATIGFEVGDGIDFSSESYTLTVKVAESEDVSEGGDTVLGDTTVTLPTGVTGTSETVEDETVTPLDQVKAFVDSEDREGFMVNRDEVYEKAGEYLDAAGDVPVRKLTLDDIGDFDGPIIIDGGDTDQVLIIDASGLPPGTVFDLSGVPFAIIIGPGHYEGGAGNNITYAGAGSQFIVLGPGNDYSDGGTGNDVVGSEGGNDTMLGGADNDLVFGGTDDDEVYGGTGSDTVVGGSVVSAASASTPGAITFDDGAGNLSYYVVTDDAGDDSIDGGDGDDTVVYVGPHSQYSISYESGVYTVVDTSEGGGTDTVTNVEHFQFADDTFSTDDTVDTTPPELETNNVTGQAISDDIVISFNEMVMSGTGEITLYKGTDLVDTFDVTDPEVSFVGNTLVVNPDGNLEYGTDYYVTFADGSVLDLACNSYEDEHDAFHFTTMNAAVAASGGSSDGISAGAVVAGVAGLGLLAFVIF